MDKMVEVYAADDVTQAYIMKAALENAGIEVVVENEYLQAGLGGLPVGGAVAVKLRVAVSQAQEAQDIIEEILRGSEAGLGGEDSEE